VAVFSWQKTPKPSYVNSHRNQPELLALIKKLSKETIRSALQLPIKTRKRCTWDLPMLKT